MGFILITERKGKNLINTYKIIGTSQWNGDDNLFPTKIYLDGGIACYCSETPEQLLELINHAVVAQW